MKCSIMENVGKNNNFFHVISVIHNDYELKKMFTVVNTFDLHSDDKTKLSERSTRNNNSRNGRYVFDKYCLKQFVKIGKLFIGKCLQNITKTWSKRKKNEKPNKQTH